MRTVYGKKHNWIRTRWYFRFGLTAPTFGFPKKMGEKVCFRLSDPTYTFLIYTYVIVKGVLVRTDYALAIVYSKIAISSQNLDNLIRTLML